MAPQSAGEQYLVNVLNLSDTQTSEILTPRTVVHMLDETTSVSDALELDASRQFARVPIYRDSTDNVTGMVIRVELFEADRAGRGGQSIATIAQPVVRVPEELPVYRLLIGLFKAGPPVSRGGRVRPNSGHRDA